MRYLKNIYGTMFIELLIAIVIFAIVFVPIITLFARSIDTAALISDISEAHNMAISEIEYMKRYIITTSDLNIKTSSLRRNGSKEWRVAYIIEKETHPIKLKVMVFDNTHNNKPPLVELITLLRG